MDTPDPVSLCFTIAIGILCYENGSDKVKYPLDEDPLDEVNVVWRGYNPAMMVMRMDQIKLNIL